MKKVLVAIAFIANSTAYADTVIGESSLFEVRCYEDTSKAHALAKQSARRTAEERCADLGKVLGGQISAWRGGLYLCYWYGQDSGIYKLQAEFSCRYSDDDETRL